MPRSKPKRKAKKPEPKKPDFQRFVIPVLVGAFLVILVIGLSRLGEDDSPPASIQQPAPPQAQAQAQPQTNNVSDSLTEQVSTIFKGMMFIPVIAGGIVVGMVLLRTFRGLGRI